jgi:glycosyltransferase involved in cell wall biosynthesis
MLYQTISIVTPSLNQGAYIEQTIKSVLDQEGDFNIDYIIADGGSVDNSVEIIKKYDYLLKRGTYLVKCKGIEFRWWSCPDKGQSDAINQGFKIAKGEILAWINSDDFYENGAFQKVLRVYIEHPENDMIYGDCYEIQMDGTKKSKDVLQGDFGKFLSEGLVLPQPATFFTRRILDKIGILDEQLHYSMDYDLFLRIASVSKPLYLKKHLAYFRIWPDSKTTTQKKQFSKEEKILRKRYGGSLINPIAIHDLRLKIPQLEYVKKEFPWVYHVAKKWIYKIINLFHY